MAEQQVKGIGGIFFHAHDADSLRRWYAEKLGVPMETWGGGAFSWNRADNGQAANTIFSIAPDTSKYFAPSTKPFMLNFIVDDLDAMLAHLRASGCAVNEKVDESEYGKFGWAMDPEGHRIELWQPPQPKVPAAS